MEHLMNFTLFGGRFPQTPSASRHISTQPRIGTQKRKRSPGKKHRTRPET